MNILITGINGFVGAHLADYLSQNSENNIYGLYRSTKYESTFNALNLQNKKNINLILGNVNIITDTQEILSDYDIDTVYHLASQSLVKNASSTPIPTYTTNIFGTLNILESVRLTSLQENKKISMLTMSSDKSYGNSKILPYTENMPLNGLDIYSSSKACEDIISRAYAYNYNLPIVVVRPCNIYGSYDFNWSRIIPQIIKAYLINSKITIYTNTAKQVREYIHVSDLVKALSILISKDNIEKTKGQSFNITSNDTNDIYDIIQLFIKVTDYNNIEYIKKEKGFKEIEKQTLDSSKIRKLISWNPDKKLNDELFNQIIHDYREWFSRTQ